MRSNSLRTSDKASNTVAADSGSVSPGARHMASRGVSAASSRRTQDRRRLHELTRPRERTAVDEHRVDLRIGQAIERGSKHAEVRDRREAGPGRGMDGVGAQLTHDAAEGRPYAGDDGRIGGVRRGRIDDHRAQPLGGQRLRGRRREGGGAGSSGTAKKEKARPCAPRSGARCAHSSRVPESDSTRFFRPLRAVSTMTFSALRLIMPIIGILTSTESR